MKANVEGYLAQCTFYDILLGQEWLVDAGQFA
jgi:hypothetical protein